MKQFVVYILASKRNGTLYVGVTSNLPRRMWEHKNKVLKGFTQKYNINQLVYYEIYDEIEYAIQREKRMKKFYRKEKLELIESFNPDWRDLYGEIAQ